MTDKLKELRELTRAATPGPWLAEDTRGGTDLYGFGLQWTIHHGRHAHYGWDGPDAALIAAMRNALPALLDVVEAARGVLLQSCPSTSLAAGWRATQATALDYLTAMFARLGGDDQ